MKLTSRFGVRGHEQHYHPFNLHYSYHREAADLAAAKVSFLHALPSLGCRSGTPASGTPGGEGRWWTWVEDQMVILEQ